MSLLGPQLEAFLAVYRHKAVTHAAVELGITQTGVTQRIRALEHDLGVTLFLRSRRGMQLTSEGQHLLSYCNGVRAQETQLYSKLEGNSSSAVVVSILGPSSIMRWRVVPIVAPLSKKYPWLRFQLEFSDTTSGINALRQNRCQLALVERSEVPLERDSKLLKPQRYFLIVPAAWKNRTIEDVVANETIVDFDEKDQMTHLYLKKYGLSPPQFTQRHFANSPESILHLVTEGVGYSVITEELLNLVQPEKYGVSVLDKKHHLDYEIGLTWYPRTAMSQYLEDIIAAIK